MAGEGTPELRPARPDDAPTLLSIARAAYARYIERMGREPMPMREDYSEAIARYSVTVAELDGEPVGYVVLTTTDDGFLVYNLAVYPRAWGRGAGKALLQHAESEARRHGYDSLYLFTHETMTENQELYARVGYREYERRRDGDSTLVYMRKQLS